jgi:hypothetical protein
MLPGSSIRRNAFECVKGRFPRRLYVAWVAGIRLGMGISQSVSQSVSQAGRQAGRQTIRQLLGQGLRVWSAAALVSELSHVSILVQLLLRILLHCIVPNAVCSNEGPRFGDE